MTFRCLFCLVLLLLVAGCIAQQPIQDKVALVTPASQGAVPTSNAANPPAPSPASPTITSTASLQTEIPTATATETIAIEQTNTPTVSASPSPTSGSSPNKGKNLLIDHTSVDLFDQIPDNYIQAASQLKMLFRHASVGFNTSEGLDCLMNKIQPRPYYCDKNVPPDQVVYNSKYDRGNWTFEPHSPPPNPNPGWWNKENYFIDRIDNLTVDESFDIVGFKFGYVDALEGSNIDQKFFNNDPNDNLPSIEELEALERRHPDKVFVYWTMGLARLSYIQSQNFNDQMRSYAIAHEKILMDIGDIESHRPDGTLCYDKDNKGIVAICDEYTDEPEGGHLNALGMQRMAKAVWVLMARLAGWNGN